MKILAIDPGPELSAYVALLDGRIDDKGKIGNEAMLSMLIANKTIPNVVLVVEWIQGYGLTAGQSIFDTCRWVGRFQQAWDGGGECHLVGRKAVKSYLCGHTTAKDSHVREALIARYGMPGTKRAPGELYGVTGDMLSALAVGLTWAETRKCLCRPF